jgi:hypothetical protein
MRELSVLEVLLYDHLQFFTQPTRTVESAGMDAPLVHEEVDGRSQSMKPSKRKTV